MIPFLFKQAIVLQVMLSILKQRYINDLQLFHLLLVRHFPALMKSKAKSSGIKDYNIYFVLF